VEQRARGRVGAEAKAVEAPGLREGGLRPAASEDAGRLKAARRAVPDSTYSLLTKKPTVFYSIADERVLGVLELSEGILMDNLEHVEACEVTKDC
jgi:hypothetical protein